ncbi:peptidoglycan/LPS O-acetylase OafA/YrhL [Mesorhizobium soli]|nr:peptidoglycan/LPS O-acetylase OafA/YrhL [Mesorhizobium soli]
MLAVFYVHFWEVGPTIEYVRVSMFFVVSGFLITLMLTRELAIGGTFNIQNFYIRRILRLFPPLALTFLAAAIFNMDGIRASLPWHALQLSNLYFMMNKTWSPWVAAHLWSLNTLEQFYLLCPIAVFFLSRSGLAVLFVAAMVLSIFVRVNAPHFGLDGWVGIVSAFDPIAAGGLLALGKDNKELQAVLRHPANIAMSVLVILTPFYLWSGFGQSAPYRLFVIYPLVSIVAGAYAGFRGPIGFLLNNGFTKFASRVSYGAYVFHLPLWWLAADCWPVLYAKTWWTFAVMTALTITVAYMSWTFVERHFDGMKQRFPIRK